MPVNKKMSIGEVLRMDGDTAAIFMSFGMHCLGCPCATAESIEDDCEVHGTNADELVEELNEFLNSKK